MKNFNLTPITKDNAQILLVKDGYDYAWHNLATQYDLYVDLDVVTHLKDVLKSRADMPESLALVFNPDLEDDWDINYNYFNTKERLLVDIDNVLYEVYQDKKGDIFAVHVDAIYCQTSCDNKPLDNPFFTAPLDILLNS